MIDYDALKFPGLKNEALPQTKREGYVARAAYIAGILSVVDSNWQRPDHEAVSAFPGEEIPAATDYRALMKKYMAFIRDWQCCPGYPVHYPTTAGDHPMFTEDERKEMDRITKEVMDETDALYYTPKNASR